MWSWGWQTKWSYVYGWCHRGGQVRNRCWSCHRYCHNKRCSRSSGGAGTRRACRMSCGRSLRCYPRGASWRSRTRRRRWGCRFSPRRYRGCPWWRGWLRACPNRWWCCRYWCRGSCWYYHYPVHRKRTWFSACRPTKRRRSFPWIWSMLRRHSRSCPSGCRGGSAMKRRDGTKPIRSISERSCTVRGRASLRCCSRCGKIQTHPRG